MNEQIKQFAEQAGIGYGNLSTGNGDNWQFAGRPAELERFAQLIVRECSAVALNIGCGDIEDELLKHFGVAD
jgi:hypothetical protein